MGLELRLDEKLLHKASLPVCRALRSDLEDRAQARIEISLWPARVIQWSSYQDEVRGSAADERIECDIWQAGADPDRLIIGASFSDNSEIYMNTLHVAKPGERSSTEVAPGLVIKTHPKYPPKSK